VAVAPRAVPFVIAPQCSPLVDCARFDALGFHFGSALSLRFTEDSRFLSVSGQARVAHSSPEWS
jgi:hypothetical protein